jgi:predicted PurR-regulated permease PerM
MPSRVRAMPLVNVLGTFAILLGLLYWARVVLMPVALAVLLTFLLNPVVNWLHRLRLGRVPAVMVVVLLAGSLLGGIGWVVTVQLTGLANDLPQYEDNIIRKITDLRQMGQGGVIEKVQKALQDIASEWQRPRPVPKGGRVAPEADKPVPVIVQQPSVLWQLPTVFEFLANAGLVIVLVIFMLINHADLRDRLVRLAGSSHMTMATQALDEAGQRISRYLLMQSLINGNFGFWIGLGVLLIGLPYAILWGFLAATLRFIPYIGPALAASFPIALSLAVFEGWWQPILVASLIAIVELVNYMVLEPWLYGQSAGVSAVALLAAIAFWTWLWGPVGLLLATPITVCIGVLSKYVPQLDFVGVLLSDEPALEPHTQYYQRLVAHDQDEATALVEAYLQEHPPETIYDTLLIPALHAAKRDRAQDILSEADVQFILTVTRSILDDLGPHLPPVGAPAAGVSTATINGQCPTPLPKVQILGCPAYDEFDELALHMFRQLLDPALYALEVVSVEKLAAEVIAMVEAQGIRLICIGAVPPGGLTPTRYVTKRLRAHFPDIKILLGRWGGAENKEAQQELLRAAGIDEIATTLLESRTQALHLATIAAL